MTPADGTTPRISHETLERRITIPQLLKYPFRNDFLTRCQTSLLSNTNAWKTSKTHLLNIKLFQSTVLYYLDMSKKPSTSHRLVWANHSSSQTLQAKLTCKVNLQFCYVFSHIETLFSFFIFIVKQKRIGRLKMELNC